MMGGSSSWPTWYHCRSVVIVNDTEIPPLDNPNSKRFT